MSLKKIRIAVFENEIVEVDGAFEYLNRAKYYDGRLDYEYFVSSQSINDFTSLKNYDLIIIDIDLSSKSEMDGFTLIKKIESEFQKELNILIVTGHEISNGYEEKHNISRYPFIEKPLSFRKLKYHFDRFFTKI